MDIYRGYASKGLVKSGTKRITPKEASLHEDAADQLISKSVQFLKAGGHTEARDLLRDASIEDMAGLWADFILGILNSPLGPETPANPIEWKKCFGDAEKHFKRALVRSPGNPCFDNNLALIKVRKEEYSEALEIWKSMNSRDPDSILVLHNIQELVNQMQSQRISPSKNDIGKIQKYYSELTAGMKNEDYTHLDGW